MGSHRRKGSVKTRSLVSSVSNGVLYKWFVVGARRGVIGSIPPSVVSVPLTEVEGPRTFPVPLVLSPNLLSWSGIHWAPDFRD